MIAVRVSDRSDTPNTPDQSDIPGPMSFPLTRTCLCISALALTVTFSPNSVRPQTGQTQPTLRETLDWLNGASELESGDGDEHIEFDGEGCHAVITEYRVRTRRGFYIRTAFNLADLDPNAIVVTVIGDVDPGKSGVQVHTRNYVKKMLASDADDPEDVAVSSYEFNTTSEFAPRFAKALKRAAELCGAKPSSY